MPDPDKDDLADALSRLAAGDAPSTPEGMPSEQVPFNPNQKVKRPASPVPSNPNPGLPPGAAKRPNAPGVQPPSPKPAAPPKPRTTGAPKSPKIVRPATPTRPEAPLPPVTGAAPLPPVTQPTDPSDISSSLANVVDDDDTVIAPAPSPEVFVHRPPPPRAPRLPLYARMNFRRTIIPILLTMGVALPACAVWWSTLDEDSPLKLLGIRFPITLAVVGVVLLALGIVNVVQVKHQLAAEAMQPRR